MLSAAEAAPTPDRKVRVCIDPEVAKKRAILLAQLDQAKLDDSRDTVADVRLSGPEPKTTARTDAVVEALEAFDSEVLKALVTLKFTRMEGDKWALLTSAHPMRFDNAIDRSYGYNYDAVTTLAARQTGVRLDDDGEHPLTEDQWTRMLKILSGHDVEAIRDAVWTLNEYEPQKHVEALVKGFGAA